MAKGAVCKIVIHRFESGRRLSFLSAEVAELVDARDLKSLVGFLHAGSSPAFGTTPYPSITAGIYVFIDHLPPYLNKLQNMYIYVYFVI